MNIGVFFGGKSPEHDVSIITGQLVISQLKKLGHTVIPVYLDKAGSWHINDQLGSLKFFQDNNREKELAQMNRFYLDMEASKKRLVLKSKGFRPETKEIDLAFPAFHGVNGEDGTIQGMFELFNVPYVGCDVYASALAADKILTKLLYNSVGIATPQFHYFSKWDWEKEETSVVDKIMSDLQFPLFVKPPQLGSSIGISKVKDQQELKLAIEVALHYGERVLVEEGVQNLADVTCCVIGNADPQPSLVQESSFDTDLFDFEEKYIRDGGAQLGEAQKNIHIPARLDEATTKEIQQQAIKVYSLLGCSGIARVDFLYDKNRRQVLASEVNPMPGTVYHHLWQASGLGLSELLEKLIGYAQERHQQKEKITYTFQSGILNYAKSIKLQLKGN